MRPEYVKFNATDTLKDLRDRLLKEAVREAIGDIVLLRIYADRPSVFTVTAITEDGTEVFQTDRVTLNKGDHFDISNVTMEWSASE